ncbi:MAG TPA: DUF3313 family protein [Woeseiaceae bacterium]|nr:DUF3313 family protein [Woeseiaceae bacterium]
MRISTFLVLAVLHAGCSSAPPTIETGPEAEVSYDGLHKVDNARFAQAWADPDIDYSVYNKIMPGEATFEFRAVKKSSSAPLQRTSSSQTEYWIEDEDKQKLIDEVTAIFREELAKSTRFTITDQPGPDVLIIRGGLHDIVSQVPPEMVGRGDIYLDSVGEATLIIEGVDSLSGETIFRAVERRSAERPGGSGAPGSMMVANTVTTWAEVRRLARRWATTLREGLDSIPRS